MYPRSFHYHRAASLKEAVSMLGQLGESAKLLAGGQSLIPLLKLRFANPEHLVDLNFISGTSFIKEAGGALRFGAMTRHAEIEHSALAKKIPVLHDCGAGIADVQVRNRGTIGGSIANNDPNADYPAACLGLGATIHTTKGKHEADSFFKGLFETALAPDEIITKVSFPLAKKAGYEKFRNQASRFALVGVFVGKRGSEIRVAVTGAGSNGVFRVKSFEEALKKRFAPKSLDGLTVPADGMNADIHGSAEYRAHLVGVMARRAVARANEMPSGSDDEGKAAPGVEFGP
jgi:aerobic carbon-monoxide dehydrogenase medium subunit